MMVVVMPAPGVAQAMPTASPPNTQATNARATISFRGIQRLGPGLTRLNMDIASLLRSALGWRDTGPGAQTERRGGARPAGACNGGKDPTGRLVSGFRRRSRSSDFPHLISNF